MRRLPSLLATGLLGCGLLPAFAVQATATYVDNARFSGDFNGDGYNDLLWRNTVTGDNYIHYLSSGGVSAVQKINTVADQQWQIEAIADINGDGRDDLIWRHQTTHLLYAYLMNGNQVTQSGFLSSPSADWQLAAVGDLNGDGREDLFWRNELEGYNYVYFMQGLTFTGGLINQVYNQTWKVAGIADFNGDGKDDIFWRNVAKGDNAFYLMKGGVQFQLYELGRISGDWQPESLCDVNGDGNVDIFWRHQTTGENYVHHMSATKIESIDYVNTLSAMNWAVSGCSDVNGDNKQDVIWLDQGTGKTAAYQMNGNQISKIIDLKKASSPWMLVSGRAYAAETGSVPEAPSVFQATATSQTAVSLSWKDNSQTEERFLLQRSVAGSNSTVTIELAANATSYQDTWLTADTTYQYVLSAQNSYGQSSSVTVQVSTPAENTQQHSAIDLSDVTSIQIQPPVLRTNTTREQQAVAVGVNSDGSLVPVSHVVEWSVADTAVATVSADGMVTVKQSSGSTVLSASFNGMTAQYTLEEKNTGYPDKFSIFLKKPTNFPDAYIYIWTIPSADGQPEEPVGAWPGVEMTDVSASYGEGWYQFEIGDASQYISYDNVVHFKFNGGLNQAESASDFIRDVADGSQWWNDADSDFQDIPPGDVTGGQLVLIKTVTEGTLLATLDAPNVDVSGDSFATGTILTVTAPAAPIGSAFSHWSGDGASYLVDATKSSSRFVVPEADVLTLIPQFSDHASDGHETGRAEYGKQCESCHGEKGDGGAFKIPLTFSDIGGNYSSVLDLANYIAEKMPTTGPGSCVGTSEGDCAYEIASMIFDDAWEGPSIRTCDAASYEDMAPAPRNLRLLTRQEYLNSVNDLTGLNFDSTLLDSIPTDPAAANFDTSADILPDNVKIAGYDMAAAVVAEQVITSKGFSGLASACGNNASCVVESFGRKVFRRPLSSAEVSRYAALYSNGDAGKTVVQALFTSPYFLFRSEVGQYDSTTGFYKLTNYEVATLLSYTFWATTPDETLLNAAASSSFDATVQAERLLNDARAKTAFARFVSGWLIDPRFNFPVIDDLDLQDAMKQETIQFVTNVVFGNLNYAELLTADYTYVNAKLAQHYGMNSAISGWQKQFYTGDNLQRSGILGHASFLASHTSTARTSPIKRGVYIRHALLCQEFPPPVAANSDAVTDDSLSIKELFKAHTDDPGCQSCHQFIDDIGWGFQNYGMDGRLRTTELALDGVTVHAVDGNGAINSLYAPETVLESGAGEPFSTLRGLAELIAATPNSSACYARQFYRYATGHKETASDECSINVFGSQFVAGQQTLKELMLEYTRLPNFMLRQ